MINKRLRPIFSSMQSGFDSVTNNSGRLRLTSELLLKMPNPTRIRGKNRSCVKTVRGSCVVTQSSSSFARKCFGWAKGSPITMFSTVDIFLFQFLYGLLECFSKIQCSLFIKNSCGLIFHITIQPNIFSDS